MPDQNHKKAKTININLTESEYEKVKQLAEVRDLNPTAYTRLTALGNRIKPTVIEYSDSSVKNSKYLNEKLEELRDENQELKEEQKYYKERVEVLNRFIKYVNEKGYIDFKSYKKDVGLMQELANYKENKYER